MATLVGRIEGKWSYDSGEKWEDYHSRVEEKFKKLVDLKVLHDQIRKNIPVYA